MQQVDEERVLLLKAVSLCKSLQDEVTVLMKDVKEFINEEDQAPLFVEPHLFKQYTIVRQCDLESIKSEVMKMKDFIPNILTPSLSILPQLTQTEKELVSLRQQADTLAVEKNNVEQKAEGYLVDYEQEKQENFELKCSLNEVKDQLQQQVNYCSSLGCVCGTMLWRTSQNEDCIQNLLSGSRVNDFLQLVSATLHSYLSTYNSDLPSESSQESQFVISLCDIAASAYGREYLSSCPEGQELLKNMCSVLATAPLSQGCAKIKSLILMLLYNISINQKGLTLLRSEPDLLRILMWLAKEDVCSTVSLYCLQLVQSLILEPLTPALMQQVMESVTPELLQEFASSKSEEFKQVACELMVDIQRLQ
ncbi:PREDICTED: heat shock factor 2-binding protein-like isoform X1 [Amphimedon queenslandica]|uniref:Heat shock factor 2-binding protein n=1 Tax=Amphimedon queenslandica TaxID=400682 RepID=A0AAN0J146_AMPQE|nr:PREDICTED: heat shock factor 2-binding protein-like isoform X1 [Amphimedon queenslandica]|eukprot:XP_019850759.1 PREDICTED: heat shock factor 2-binding protein-like isoform X1 [Amphimedon queenslandica]